VSVRGSASAWLLGSLTHCGLTFLIPPPQAYLWGVTAGGKEISRKESRRKA